MKALIGILAATAALTLTGPIANAGANTNRSESRSEVDTGRFQTLPGGTDLGYSIEGHAVIVRSGDDDPGRTFVSVHVRGLNPNTTYPTHVHNQPCSWAPPGGSHYQHLVGGVVDSINEIWPTVQTNASGNGSGRAVHDHRARSDAQSIVIHYPLNPSIRLACVDLQ